jgi:hypothetical protein
VSDDIAHSNGSLNENGGAADRPAPRVGRRKMLLGVAAAGMGASVVAEASPAAAKTPDTVPKVKLGKANTATATTSISMAVNGDSGIEGIDTSSGGGYGVSGTSASGTGVNGIHSTGDGNGVEGLDNSGKASSSGVYGSSDSGNGVYGASTDGTGVRGMSSDGGIGVLGTTSGSNASGIAFAAVVGDA